jgi:hypothetical protein
MNDSGFMCEYGNSTITTGEGNAQVRIFYDYNRRMQVCRDSFHKFGPAVTIVTRIPVLLQMCHDPE